MLKHKETKNCILQFSPHNKYQFITVTSYVKINYEMSFNTKIHAEKKIDFCSINLKAITFKDYPFTLRI